MRRLPWGLIWLGVAAVGLGLFAYSLGLDESDKLASVGSFVLALFALISAARTYLRSGEGRSAAAGQPKYHVENHGNPERIYIGDRNTVHEDRPKKR